MSGGIGLNRMLRRDGRYWSRGRALTRRRSYFDAAVDRWRLWLLRSTGAARLGRWCDGHPGFDAAMSDGRPLVAARSLAEGWMRAPQSWLAARRSAAHSPAGFPQQHGGRIVFLRHLGAKRSPHRLRGAQAVVIDPGLWISQRRLVLELASSGAPLVAPDEHHDTAELRSLTGAERAGALSDVRVRELHSVRVRRKALESTHPADRDRKISIVMATQRPDCLSPALDMIARQRRQPNEVLVGLHGDRFASDVEERLGRGGVEFRRYDAAWNLGEILHDLTRATAGDLVTKWDDDDWYGSHHLQDLESALDYARADLVGKAAEFVYLEDVGVTLRRMAVGAETFSSTLAGGTLMVRRGAYDRAGGWPLTPRDVDRGLVDRVSGSGGAVYRTHGYEYVLRRSADGHTWSASSDYFIRQSVEQRSGLDLAFAGFDDD